MYAQVFELVSSFSQRTITQLSNDDSRATEPNLSVVEQALKIASERIDLSLRSRYVLPLKEDCTLLNSYCLDIARHWLYNRRPEMKMPESVQATYKLALSELDKVADGKLHLGLRTVEIEDDLTPEAPSFKVKAPKATDTRGY